jgi:site-specific recombinase XerD
MCARIAANIEGELLGHESIATTERYLAVDDSEIRAAVAAAG